MANGDDHRLLPAGNGSLQGNRLHSLDGNAADGALPSAAGLPPPKDHGVSLNQRSGMRERTLEVQAGGTRYRALGRTSGGRDFHDSQYLPGWRDAIGTARAGDTSQRFRCAGEFAARWDESGRDPRHRRDPHRQRRVLRRQRPARLAETRRSLRGMPVWIVIRLYTDEESVVSYCNDLDCNLELNLEVLDDLGAEAHEVHENNRWLNYDLPLQRMREMEFHDLVFDLIDERVLSKDELFAFMRILFGTELMDGIPELEANWNTFVSCVANMVLNEKRQWNPLTRRLEPWVDIRRLKRDFGGGWFGR